MIEWILSIGLFFFSVAQVQPFTPEYDTLTKATQYQAPLSVSGVYFVLKHDDPKIPKLEVGDAVYASIDGEIRRFDVTLVSNHNLIDPQNPNGKFTVDGAVVTWEEFYTANFHAGDLVIMTCTGEWTRVVIVAEEHE